MGNMAIDNAHVQKVPMHNMFSVIYRHGKIMHDRAVRQFGLTGQQMGYLKYISENPGIPQEMLVKYMHIDKGTVAKAIKDMEKKGYVIREQNSEDRRAYCLFLTDKAKNIAARGMGYAELLEKQLTQGMSEEEVRTFKKLLGKVTSNMANMIDRGEID